MTRSSLHRLLALSLIGLLLGCEANGDGPNPGDHGGTGPDGPYDIIGPASPTPAPTPSPTPMPTPTPLPDFGCGGPIVEGDAMAAGSTSAECASCTVSNTDNVVDLDPDTFGSMDLSAAAPGGSTTITVTAQEGVVYPSGNVAGAVLAIPGGDVQGQVMPTIDIVTMLGGAAQETRSYSATLVGDIGGQFGDDNRFFLGFETSQQFDGVAVVVRPQAGSLASAVNDYVHCGEAAAPSEQLPAQVP